MDREESQGPGPGETAADDGRAQPRRAFPRPALLDVAAPDRPIARLPPAQLEPYILAGIHQDRTPGNVLVVLHPNKRFKLPDGLFEGLRQLGFTVIVEETLRDTRQSVAALRDRLRLLQAEPLPLDVIVVGGDGTLDHHFLIAAFAAFYPELVAEAPGVIDAAGLTDEQRAALPEPLRTVFGLDQPLPEIEPTSDNIQTIWVLRSVLEPLLAKGAPLARLLKATQRSADDPLLRLAVLATLHPGEVRLVPDHFDLSRLAAASQQDTFRGLYPFIRAIVPYPAGTAADNAVFAGVPGWGYAISARMLHRFGWLRPLARKFGRRARHHFLRYFAGHGSTVVPARLSLACVDGRWQRITSHAIGGPASGRFFSGDLTHKAASLTGYLLRAPKVVLQEAFGSTVVEVESRDTAGVRKSYVQGRLAEGLYTNRTFIGGVGAIPTTTPTSFGGESSLVVLSPLLFRDEQGRVEVNPRGVLTFLEAIVKGVLGRGLHLFGLDPGKLAGEGKMIFLQNEYQVAIQEGEEIRIGYRNADGRARAVPAQISGDPFQAIELGIKVLWGPIPLLAARRSLLLASTQRTLNHLRLQESYRLDHVHIGGVRHFRHVTGLDDPVAMLAQTGLVPPPLYLPTSLRQAQRELLRDWQTQAAVGEFSDTSEPGLVLRRRGLFCHNNDQTAHLLLLKEGWNVLLVRQLRRHGPELDVYETRTRYQWMLGGYRIHQSQTMHHPRSGLPRLLAEQHFFRDAEEFQQMAPSYFPLLATSPDSPVFPLVGALLKEQEPPLGASPGELPDDDDDDEDEVAFDAGETPDSPSGGRKRRARKNKQATNKE